VQASAEVLTDAGGLAELAKKDVDELENLGTVPFFTRVAA
jgi:hypothetical protein